MTAANLARVQRAVDSATERLHHATWERNEMVSAAVAEGWTHARIAEATGLTRSRVGQLALAPRQEDG